MSPSEIALVVGVAFAAWFALNMFAPLALLSGSSELVQPLEPGQWNEIAIKAGIKRVHYRVKDRVTGISLTFSIGPFAFVLIDRRVIDAVQRGAFTPKQFEVMIAHEIGHLVNRHPQRKFWHTVFLLRFMPGLRGLYREFEEEADRFAEKHCTARAVKGMRLRLTRGDFV